MHYHFGRVECQVWSNVKSASIPASKVYAEFLGQGFTQGSFASARGPMKQHHSVPADQLIVDMLVSKKQGAEGILQQAGLDLCIVHKALPKSVKLP